MDFAAFRRSFEQADGLMSIDGEIVAKGDGDVNLVRLLKDANKILQKIVCEHLKIVDDSIVFMARQSLRLLDGSIEDFAQDGESDALAAVGEELFFHEDAIFFALHDHEVTDSVAEAIRSLDLEFDSEEAIEAGFAIAGVALVRRLVVSRNSEVAMIAFAKLNGLIMSIDARFDERSVIGRRRVIKKLKEDPKQHAKAEIKEIWLAKQKEYQWHGGKKAFALEMVLKSDRKITQWMAMWGSEQMSLT